MSIGPALSPSARDRLLRLPPPVDPSLFTPGPPPSGPPRCVAVGRFVAQKGFDTLVEAWRLVVTGWCLRRRLWAEASWVGVQVLAFSLSYWFFSVNRATLLWFPLWIMLARWGTWKPARPGAARVHRLLVLGVWALGVVLLLGWSWLFFTGHWAS